MDEFSLSLVDIEKPEELNFILGQTHFIKSVEDLYEAMVNSVPDAKFGIAFCEASGARKVRSIGNNDELQVLAEKNAMDISAGHSFIIFMKNSNKYRLFNSSDFLQLK